ncbi:sensor histidine kinase [Spirosoma sp. KNUC1025]|uniref:sensor histidine kinase n=1 Tax=Spirosoma sp. KNUC1025 TaxID=2894082 RepID=UPI00386EF387|nr:histidine kinase [Spirosoma sp. KNUC1025]
MAGLRSQMNPHFIFNCLNSIKLYATENDSEKASDYLTKFSRLIRMVLENSRSERVTLQNELTMLQLYAEMEIMRFKQKLSFFVEVEPGIDANFVEIPPLLIQPYVENAIWHGLMHKPEGGSVRIQASQPQENLLQLTIKDDGVGRARAAELRSKSASHRKSFGLKMTSERIALVNQLYQTRTQVAIEDLVDADGQPAGTEIILQIPI